jgi:hypothetical protein
VEDSEQGSSVHVLEHASRATAEADDDSMAAHHVGEREPGGSAEHLGLLSSSGSGVGLMASLTVNTSSGGGALVAVISHGEAETMGKPGEIEQTMGQGTWRREC